MNDSSGGEHVDSNGDKHVKKRPLNRLSVGPAHQCRHDSDSSDTATSPSSSELSAKDTASLNKLKGTSWTLQGVMAEEGRESGKAWAHLVSWHTDLLEWN